MSNVRGRTVNTRTCWKMSIGAAVLVIGGTAMPVESKSLPHLRQIASMRPADSLKVMPLPEGFAEALRVELGPVEVKNHRP